MLCTICNAKYPIVNDNSACKLCIRLSADPEIKLFILLFLLWPKLLKTVKLLNHWSILNFIYVVFVYLLYSFYGGNNGKVFIQTKPYHIYRIS